MTSENQEINLNFDHEKLKNQMIKLLNQFENVDEFYREDIEFGKPPHSRGLRKIYNKMFEILENNYKNLPKELEKYNKTVPKEEKEKITKTVKKTPKIPIKPPKNTNNTKKNNKSLQGGNNQENNENTSFLTTQKNSNENILNENNSKNNIFSKSSQINYNIDDTLISVMETDNNDNKENKLYEEIKKLYDKIANSVPKENIKNDLNILNSYKDKVNIFIQKTKNESKNIKNPKYQKEIKSMYDCSKTLYNNFEKIYYLSYQ